MLLRETSRPPHRRNVTARSVFGCTIQCLPDIRYAQRLLLSKYANICTWGPRKYHSCFGNAKGLEWRSRNSKSVHATTFQYVHCKSIVAVEWSYDDLIGTTQLRRVFTYITVRLMYSNNCSQTVQKDSWIQTKKAWVSTPICPSPTQTPSASLLRPR